MITVAEIKSKALHLWTSKRLPGAWLRRETLFPYRLACKSPRGTTLSDAYPEVRRWITSLTENDKSTRGCGYDIEFRDVNHRLLGPQRLPHQIVFRECDDLISWIGKSTEFAQFTRVACETLEQWPALEPGLQRSPGLLLDNLGVWSQLLAVCRYFHEHPRPGLYLRQLDIAGVDSKFIESHRGVLRKLLDAVLLPEAIDADSTGLSQHGFERRFGLSYDPPRIRYRLLDPAVGSGSARDLSIPVSDFNRLHPSVDTVFLTENKTNGLCFPERGGSMVIFGLGYGVNTLVGTSWLDAKKLYYWGDIDTHGFAIIDQLRKRFAHVRSMLMDEETLKTFRPLWGVEPDERRHLGDLEHLRPEEQALYDKTMCSEPTCVWSRSESDLVICWNTCAAMTWISSESLGARASLQCHSSNEAN